MANYYRITAYCKEKDFSAIFDCYGMFEKKWQFSVFIKEHGMRIIEVNDYDQIEEVNLQMRPTENPKQIIYQASAMGKPIITETNGRKTITVGDSMYITRL